MTRIVYDERYHKSCIPLGIAKTKRTKGAMVIGYLNS